MPSLNDVLAEKIALLAKKGQQRRLVSTSRSDAMQIIRGDTPLISFADNDYFGLSQHPEVIAAAVEATKKYGAGAGASRLVSGNHPLYEELEKKLATAKGTESALVFGSGYLANLGVIPALMNSNDLILADKFAHACMIDAGHICGANFMRFAHNNMEHLRLLLATHREQHQNCLILTETVFSMDGDRAPMAELIEIAREFDCWLMSDDAHGLGVIQQPDKAEIQMGTLSKSLGSYGGYVAGSKMLIDYLQTTARSLIYSTALPPATIASATKALSILEADEELREAPFAYATYFTQLLGIEPAQSAIVPVILGDNDKALAASDMLKEHGYYVAAIRPPTVPENTARLRFTFSATHHKEDIEKVAELLLTKGYVTA